jgi:hypothetical protein
VVGCSVVGLLEIWFWSVRVWHCDGLTAASKGNSALFNNLTRTNYLSTLSAGLYQGFDVGDMTSTRARTPAELDPSFECKLLKEAPSRSGKIKRDPGKSSGKATVSFHSRQIRSWLSKR